MVLFDIASIRFLLEPRFELVIAEESYFLTSWHMKLVFDVEIYRVSSVVHVDLKLSKFTKTERLRHE